MEKINYIDAVDLLSKIVSGVAPTTTTSTIGTWSPVDSYNTHSTWPDNPDYDWDENGKYVNYPCRPKKYNSEYNTYRPHVTETVYWPDYKCDDAEECKKSIKSINFPGIKKVIYNEPVTVVFFNDGTKVTVKASNLDEFDKERGLVYALVKRLFATEKDESGEVFAKGYSMHLNKLIKDAFDQKEFAAKQRAEKNAKKAAKKAAEKANAETTTKKPARKTASKK